MKPVYLDRLARLASLKLQRRYYVHAVKDSYILPAEMLDDVVDLPEEILREMESSGSVSSEQRLALLGLAEAIREHASQVPLDDSISKDDLIERNPSWLAIREAAGRCVKALGVDLQQWERSEMG
jgi:hypothetical protein